MEEIYEREPNPAEEYEREKRAKLRALLENTESTGSGYGAADK